MEILIFEKKFRYWKWRKEDRDIAWVLYFAAVVEALFNEETG